VPVFIIIFVVMVLPKLTGGSGGPPPAAAAGGTDTTTGVGTPVAATTPAVGTPTPTATPAPASTGISAPSYSFSSDDGQLQRFSGKLKTKDPFAGATEVTVPVATVPLVSPPVPKTNTNTPGTTGTGTSTTPGTKKPQTQPYIYAVISVNGLAEGVALKSLFPAASPMFTLTAIGSGWIKFSLVTGSFASGAKEVTLAKGKSVTLRNTADGSRFTVHLVTVSQAVPTTTGPTSTNPTDTLATPTAATDTTSTTPPPPTTPAS
jgi:hypothetical protein